MRSAEFHSLSAEENRLTSDVASLRSAKVAPTLAPLKRLSPCEFAVFKYGKSAYLDDVKLGCGIVKSMWWHCNMSLFIMKSPR